MNRTFVFSITLCCFYSMSSCQDNESEVVAEIKETLEQIEYVPEDYHLVLTDDFNWMVPSKN